MTKKFDRALLLDCASEVLNWIALQDPMFAERIDITRTEYKLDDLQVLCAYVARTLDLGEHMYYCEREFMQPGYAGHLGPRECKYCNAIFSPGRADDQVCPKQACLDRKAAELDQAFAAKQA